jgi:hypothetical protein
LISATFIAILLLINLLLTVEPDIAYARQGSNRRDRRPDRELRIPHSRSTLRSSNTQTTRPATSTGSSGFQASPTASSTESTTESAPESPRSAPSGSIKQ